MKFFLYILISFIFLGFGCNKSLKIEEKKDKPLPQKFKKKSVGPLCIGAIHDSPAKNIKIAGIDWQQKGSTLNLIKPIEGNVLNIGVFSNLKEWIPKNVNNIKKMLKWFKEENVHLILNAGDLSYNKEGIISALDLIGDLNVLVLNVIGNRGSNKEFNSAIEQVQKKHKHVLNASIIRKINTPYIDILSLPGYWNHIFLHSKDGCKYTKKDMNQLEKLVKSTDSKILLLSHATPKQIGKTALDITSDGDHVGDPLLKSFIEKHKISFGVFGNIHESGGYATNLKGNKHLPQNTLHDKFYLNPGPLDGVLWEMNDKSVSQGMAAIITVKNGKASYKIKHLNTDKIK